MKQVLVGCVLTIALCWWSVFAWRGAVERATGELAALTSRTSAATAAVEQTRSRLAVVEADTAKLLDRIATLSSERRQAQRSPSNQAIRDRHSRARAFAERGEWQQALAEYRWCYDYAFLRTSSLVENFARLAATYPPAAAELQVRLQEAEVRARHDLADTDSLLDFITLDRVMNESARSIAFHDDLPEADERRIRIRRVLVKEFIARQRYADLSTIIPTYESTITDLDNRLKLQHEGPHASLSAQNENQRVAIQRARDAQLKATLDSAALAMEVRAGLGESERARTIAEKIFLLDTSPETRAAVGERLERAATAGSSGLPR